MSQLENFRESLKKREPQTENSRQNPSESAPKEDEKRKPSTPSSKKKIPKKRGSIGVSEELHTTLKAVSFWMKKEGIMNNPGLVDAINLLLEEYFKAHPGAKKFSEDFLK